MGKPRDIRHYVLYQALQELGWSDADPQAIAHRVRLLEIGLPAEDELSVVLRWPGGCHLVHKLDQTIRPGAALYRIPDLLAVFDYEGRPLPVLAPLLSLSVGDAEVSWRKTLIEDTKPLFIGSGLREAARRARETGFLASRFDSAHRSCLIFCCRWEWQSAGESYRL